MFRPSYPLAFHETRIHSLFNRTLSIDAKDWEHVFPQLADIRGYPRVDFIVEALNMLKIPYGTIPTTSGPQDLFYVHRVEQIGVIQENVDRLDNQAIIY